MKTNLKYAFDLAKKLHLLIGYRFIPGFESKVKKMSTMNLSYLKETDFLISEINRNKVDLLSFHQTSNSMEEYRTMQLKINNILEKYDVLQSEQAIKQLKAVQRIVKSQLKTNKNGEKLEVETIYNHITHYARLHSPKMS